MIINQLEKGVNNLSSDEMKQLCDLKNQIDLANSNLNELDGLHDFYKNLNVIPYQQGILNNFTSNFGVLGLKDDDNQDISTLVSQQSCN